jgi:hypothetical protein
MTEKTESLNGLAQGPKWHNTISTFRGIDTASGTDPTHGCFRLRASCLAHLERVVDLVDCRRDGLMDLD